MGGGWRWGRGDAGGSTGEEIRDSGSEEGQLTQFMCDATMRRATGREVGQGVWCQCCRGVGWGGRVGGRVPRWLERGLHECQEEG